MKIFIETQIQQFVWDFGFNFYTLFFYYYKYLTSYNSIESLVI